jgi:hypothetical protein
MEEVIEEQNFLVIYIILTCSSSYLLIFMVSFKMVMYFFGIKEEAPRIICQNITNI